MRADALRSFLAAALLATGAASTANAATAANIANAANAASAANTASTANTAEPPVRLLAPRVGAVLTAGSTAVLEWAPGADLARPGGWEEWEAFLSLDGGATYPVRITPHLDRALRRVTFRVPSFPTEDGRLLLRLGDEQREAAFALPERFTIVATAAVGSIAGVPAGGAIDLPWISWRSGEPARPGDAGVVAWVEGARGGGPTRAVVAAEPTRAVPGFALPAGRSALLAVPSAPPPSGAPALDSAAGSAPPPPPRIATAIPAAPHLAATDLLVLQKRRNE